MDSIAYKIENADTWQHAMDNGVYNGSALDVRDGFIHLSSYAQLQETLNLHFKGQKNLIIAKVNLDICEKVVWEESRGGVLFPHLYAPLKSAAIIEYYDASYDGEYPKIPPQFND